jgi:acyl-CoA synthetase (AMP-forming)/AMP-acid ligase II/enoyl-CoA hydratase/carnithine racemase
MQRFRRLLQNTIPIFQRSTYSTVLVEHPLEGVTSIALNRPHRLNALNATLLQELGSVLREHAHSRVIILSGAGGQAFCAGEDLKESLAPASGSADELRRAFSRLQDITRLTSMSPALVIAAVQGYAVGGGAEIALGCDFVIGDPNASFRFPEVAIGHAATGGITARLTSMVGLLKAKELLIRGQFVNAEEAKCIGLLTELVDDPKARALELAGELAALPRVAASQSKMSLERGTFPMMENALQDEINTAAVCFAQADSAKAFSDFEARKSKPGTAVSWSKMTDLNTALDHAASTYSSRTFLRFTRPLRDITYRQFAADVTRLATGLHAAGIRPGDRVLTMMHTCHEAVQIWFAVNKLGAIWVPINAELKSQALYHAVEISKPKIAIVHEDFFHLLQDAVVLDDGNIYVLSKSPTPNPSAAQSFENLLQDPSSSSLTSWPTIHPSTTAAFLFTSGTTGRSKPCILSHGYFIHAARNLSCAFDFHPTDVLYCPFPLFHIDATALTIIPALLLGATAALSPRFSVSKFWEEIRETQATVYDFMGATLGLLWKAPPSAADTESSVRLAWGVPLPKWKEEYEKRFGHRIVEVYGSVETGLPIAEVIDRERVNGSCGRITTGSGYSVRITDEYGQPVTSWTKAGELLLRSDDPNAIFGGYYGADQATAECFRGTWLHTGDIARMDQEGNLFFVGRMKDVIRRRGEMTSALAIEEEVSAHPGVRLAAAIGVPTSIGEGAEEDVKVVVVRNHGREGDELTERGLWEWCRERMSRFMVPDLIEIVLESEMEVTETGKVSKKGMPREVGRGVRFDSRTQ